MYTYDVYNVQFLDTKGGLTGHKVNARRYHETEARPGHMTERQTK